jgi:hypothetical protein
MLHLLFQQSGHPQQRINWVMTQFSPGKKACRISGGLLNKNKNKESGFSCLHHF